jgi:hypothetical protein
MDTGNISYGYYAENLYDVKEEYFVEEEYNKVFSLFYRDVLGDYAENMSNRLKRAYDESLSTRYEVVEKTTKFYYEDNMMRNRYACRSAECYCLGKEKTLEVLRDYVGETFVVDAILEMVRFVTLRVYSGKPDLDVISDVSKLYAVWKTCITKPIKMSVCESEPDKFIIKVKKRIRSPR